VECSRTDGVLHVRLTEGDIASPVDLHQAFEKFIIHEGDRRIVVDLSDVRALTSLMIGTLVSLHLLAYENVVVLTFENMHPRITALFKLIGVDKLMELHYGRALTQ
jgi:anti-anti-sigma regulatory factor